MQANRYGMQKHTNWEFHPGTEFTDMEVFRATRPADVQFKVWDNPAPDGMYIVAADPAYGHNEKCDRSAIQVLRAYADGCDQVAEFAWPLVNTDQFAWIIMAVAAWYAGDASTVYLIVELNGPGDAVWRAIHKLPRQINQGHFRSKTEDKGLQDVFRNVRNFYYTRSDSMGAGRAWQWKTTPQLKESCLEELRSHTESFSLQIRSMATLREMMKIQRNESTIEAMGANKDDRVMTLALGVRCWLDRVRGQLLAKRRDRQYETTKQSMTFEARADLFGRAMLDAFFAQKAAARRGHRMAMAQGWRSRR
jgi:hypothetical protein